VLMELDARAVIESMAIAGLAVGAEKGYLYVRGEYPVAWARLREAVDELTEQRVLGPDVLRSGQRFGVEVRKGAGAYICGEETALFNSIEGHRGEPRSKPPFPTEVGLFGKPTVVNNIETLLAAREIVAGRPDAARRKLFCVSGAVERPGVYEVDLAIPLRSLLDRAGAIDIQAVLLGGAAGSLLTPDEIDVSLSFEGVRAVGATLGSGVVLVVPHSVDLSRFVLRIAEFFQDESCGQCVPCRVGTARQVEALHRLATAPNDHDRAALRDVGRAMQDASICGLGQTAYAAVESAVTKFGVFGG